MTEAFVSVIKNRCHSIIASGDVTFRYVVVDDDVLKPLMPFFESTTGLFFDHCKIDLSVELLCDLLASSKCVKLGVNECQFVKSTLDDKILSSMSHCDVLALRWCKPKRLPGITYRTLLRWENQKRLPKEIDFEGMSTDFTTFELVSLIKAFEREHHEWFSSPNETSKPPPAEWNLGEVILIDNPYRLLHTIEGIEVRRSALISEDREEYEVLPSWASHIADDSFVVIEFITRASSKRRHAPLSDNI
ncbi:unnamed protein product [Toxocara canis]|uniref:Uncharacterized protein n=1 Tax=Toxocara canis TaxID=6265 RepID=A0A3P7IKL0_TOXCA|nr:unnamed protein product [Toxocara canis]